MADFAAKLDFFTWKALAAGAIFFALCLWIRPAIRRFTGRPDVLFTALVLAVPFTIVAGAIRLNAVSLVSTTLVVAAVGFLGKRGWIPNRTPIDDGWSAGSHLACRLAIVALSGVAIFNFVDERLWVHYDYFSQSIAAFDLGLNGRSPSAWMTTFDPSRWFIVSQGIMPVFDAFEVFVNGFATTALSQLLLLGLMILALRAAPRRIESYVVLTVVFAMYLIDYNRAPRPHVFVGVIGSLFLLRLHAHARWAELLVYLAVLMLAKRDGLALGAVILAVYLVRYVQARYGWLVVGGVSVALALCVAFLLNSWVALWERTPLSALIFALSHAGYLSLVQRPEVAQSLAAAVIVISVMAYSRLPVRTTLVPAIFSAFVIVSAVTVDGVGSYNFGTILRKLFFMQCPVLLCGVLLAYTFGRDAAEPAAATR